MPFSRLFSFPRSRRRSRGQSIVEFALIAPIMLVLLVAIADLARIYTTMMTVESAAREAADYGAFYTFNWEPANRTLTEDEMTKRACIAASDLPGYAEPTGTVDHETCTNPTVQSIELILPAGAPVGTECSDIPREDEPCWVEVTLAYTFRLIAPIGFQIGDVHIGFPNELTFERSSIFALSDFELREP